MSYPIKDKIAVNEIKKNFEKEIDKITSKENNYTDIIKTLRETVIPAEVSNLLEDKQFKKEHAFESMPCNHKDIDRLSFATCTRCQFNKREIECENLINSLTGLEKRTTIKVDGTLGPDVPLKKLKIIRGKYDDVIGYSWVWGV